MALVHEALEVRLYGVDHTRTWLRLLNNAGGKRCGRPRWPMCGRGVSVEIQTNLTRPPLML